LEGGRVEAFAAAVESPLDRELGDDRLPRAGRRRHAHRAPRVQRIDRINLERIEGEVVSVGEGCRGGHRASLGTGSYGAMPQVARCALRSSVKRAGGSTFVGGSTPS